MAAAPKSLKIARLQSSIDKIFGDWGIEHLVIIFTLYMFTIFASMKWHYVGTYSLTLGFFGNPFIWGACAEEARNVLNLRDQLIHGGETSDPVVFYVMQRQYHQIEQCHMQTGYAPYAPRRQKLTMSE